MRRACCLTLGLATIALAATGATGVAHAQTTTQPAAAPARYLSWAGRPAALSADAATADVSAPPAPVQRRPNRVIPHGGALPAPAASPVASPDAPRRTLTPANAWMRPATAATAEPHPVPMPVARSMPVPVPVPAPERLRAPVDYVPDQGGRGQAVPAEIALDASRPDISGPAAPPPPPSDDPMAPRRDAPIFRMQQTRPDLSEAPPPPAAAVPQGPAEAAAPPEPRRVALVAGNPDDRPVEQGARYYSVHRQNGRSPDALTMPQPTYVDALAITTPVTLASQDLAQPDQGPTLIRDAQGRMRAQPAAPEGDYQ